MAFLRLKSPLSAEERLQRRRLVLSDTLSLATLAIITALLALATNALYQSYASNQIGLSRRWLERGESALRQGNPEAAIHALHSALALAPGERTIEIELATALASAGRIQEAVSYFNTLSESEPGNGMLNLQLARLAARQNNVSQALEYYHRSIYGNWEGNGYVRRREVRIEMVNFLISCQNYTEARNELLVAAGNAPAGDNQLLLEIAQSLERAQAPADALRIYKSVLEHDPSSLQAMDGAGRMAFHLGHYLEAKQYLQRAVNGSGAGRETPEVDRHSRDLLRDSTQLLLLYPSPQLSPRNRGLRILIDRQIALARLASCASSQAAENATPVPSTGKTPAQSLTNPSPLEDSLRSFASRFKRHPAEPAASSPPGPPTPSPLEILAARWKQQPSKITLSRLERDPALVQAQIQLIYDTEQITQQVCGAPTGDDALLLKISQAPNAVEQE